MDSFHIFFKEASIRPNNNHVIFRPLQADLFYSMNGLEIWHASLINLNNKVITSGLQTTNRKPSVTKRHIHLLISRSNPAQPHCKPPSPAIPSLSHCLWLWMCDICDISADVVLVLSPLGPVFADIMTLCSFAAVELTPVTPAPNRPLGVIRATQITGMKKKKSVSERVNCE